MRRRYLLGCLAAAGLAWCAADEEKIWKEYVDWYRKQPIDVSDPRTSYLEHLRRSGLGSAEVQERSKVIERLARQRREELQPFFFDRTYSSATPRFNTAPNALLAEAARMALCDADPRTTILRASREYRLAVLPVLVEEALTTAVKRAEAHRLPRLQGA